VAEVTTANWLAGWSEEFTRAGKSGDVGDVVDFCLLEPGVLLVMNGIGGVRRSSWTETRLVRP